MAYTLRGRLETRLAVALGPLLAAAALALVLGAWWPVVLAALMLGVGLALDAALYHRALPYQAGWVALPLAALELAAVMGLALAAGVSAPLLPAVAFFLLAWLLGQGLVHAAFPLLRLTYGEDGGELGGAGAAVAAATLLLLAGAGGVAWATQPPTVRLPAGVHAGPLVLDREQTLVGAPGAVVRGGIVVTADGVTVRDVEVIGGENGIEVEGATGVLLERVAVSGAELDGIHVRRGSVTVRDCDVDASVSEYAQGIDVSFAFDLPPSVIDGCRIHGGQEGIVTHFAHVVVRANRVTDTSLRAITLTEMSAGSVEENEVEGAVGVGIFCGDYSVCEIEQNVVSGTQPDADSGDGTQAGYGIVAHYGAKATLEGNTLRDNANATGSFSRARISSE